MSEFNPVLIETLRTLQDCIDRLRSKLTDATDPNLIRKINLEIVEISHRKTMIGSMIFAEQAAKIEESAAAVDEAKEEIFEAIEEIEKLNEFLKTISSFLGLVDKLIDIIK
jgi:hypothetical protein